jgi:3-oxoadipate enol-lactonase
MPHAEVRGQRLHYRDTGGEGLPLVLGHGFLMDADMFEPQVHALGGRRRLITWDQRGHGQTESSSEPFTYWDSADDLAALVDTLGIERAVIGGMSQGGFIALRFAIRHPERTAGLVLIDTQSGVEDPDKAASYDLMHDVWTGSGASDQLAEMVAAIIIGPDPEVSAPWIAKWKARDPASLTQIYRTLMDRDDVSERLGEITAPALVVHGTADAAIDVSIGETLAGELPACRALLLVEGAGHASNLTHPEPVNRALDQFLDSL